MLALDAVSGVREVVVGALDGQRNGDGQRLAEISNAAVVLEGTVVGIIGGATPESGLVVSLNHGLIRVGVENYES